METSLCKLMVLPLDYFELAPLHHFLSLSSLPPVKIKDIYHSNQGDMKCVLSIPTDFEAAAVRQMWCWWKEENLWSDYAMLN